MYDWILLMALTLSALSLTTAFIVCRRCRRMRREKERSIAQALLEQERLIRELAHTRSEKQHLRQVIKTKLPAWKVGSGADSRTHTDPQRFDTPYNN